MSQFVVMEVEKCSLAWGNKRQKKRKQESCTCRSGSGLKASPCLPRFSSRPAGPHPLRSAASSLLSGPSFAPSLSCRLPPVITGRIRGGWELGGGSWEVGVGRRELGGGSWEAFPVVNQGTCCHVPSGKQPHRSRSAFVLFRNCLY